MGIDVGRGDGIPEHQIFSYLNGVGNHEGKMITAAHLALHHDYNFSASELYHGLLDIQPRGQAGWPELEARQIGKWCTHSLLPIGTVISVPKPGRRGTVNAFQASDFGVGGGLAIACTLLEWSVVYDDISVQEVYGATTSTTGQRSPELRHKLLENFIRTFPQPRSWGEIAKDIGMPDKTARVSEHIRRMANRRLLVIDSKLADYDPKFRISDYEPATRRDGRRNAAASPEALTIHQAAAQLRERHKPSYTLKELIDECLKIDPLLDGADIRSCFVINTSPSSQDALHEIELLDRNDNKTRANTLTSAALVPQKEAALRELVKRIVSLKSADTVEEKRATARQLLSDPELVAKLFSKAKRFSAGHYAQTEGGTKLREKLLTIAEKVGAITISSAMEILANDPDNRILDRETLAVNLRRLAKQGMLEVSTERKDASHKHTERVYRPIR